jgi:transcriptional regulator with XRE-family HTH domain
MRTPRHKVSLRAYVTSSARANGNLCSTLWSGRRSPDAWHLVRGDGGGPHGKAACVSAPALPPIGERLRQARLRRGMTVRGLARVVDVSASLISQIETGKSSPSVSTLYAITAALDISIEDVFGTVGAARRGTDAVPERADLALAAPVPASAAPLEPAAPAHSGAAPVSPAAPNASDPRIGVDRTGESAVTQGLRQLAQKRRVGPVVTPEAREVLRLDSGVTW